MGKGVDLPTLPELEADPSEHLRFANQALRRKWAHIVRVRKYGNVAPMLVLVFDNRDELMLTAQQHKYGGGLRDAMHSYDGIICPAYTKPQLEIVYAALIKAADIWEADDERGQLALDLNAFLTRCLLVNDHDALRRPEGDDDPQGAMYRAVCDFQYVNRDRSGHPAEHFPVLLFWSAPEPDRWGNQHDTTRLWIPRGALATYLRAVRNWTTGAHLKNLLFSLGWQTEDLQARSKADWTKRAKAHVWMVPVPWEPGEIDLLASASVPTSPDVPISNTRARDDPPSRARTRRERDVRGRGDARQKWDVSDGHPRRGENRGL